LSFPTFLRKIKTTAFIVSMVAPLESLHREYRINRKNNLLKIQYNGQTCKLRRALNDRFDPERRIKIISSIRFERKHIYTKAEQRTKYLGKIYLRQRADFVDTGVDFIVQIPKELEPYIAEIEAMTKYYRLASKRFKIEII